LHAAVASERGAYLTRIRLDRYFESLEVTWMHAVEGTRLERCPNEALLRLGRRDGRRDGRRRGRKHRGWRRWRRSQTTELAHAASAGGARYSAIGARYSAIGARYSAIRGRRARRFETGL